MLLDADDIMPDNQRKVAKTAEEKRLEKAAQKQKKDHDARLDKRRTGGMTHQLTEAGKNNGAKALDANRKNRRDLEAYIKGSLLEDLLTKALCYGESLTVCREIQHNF